MRYQVTHQTIYSYEEIVSICHNEVRLEPRATARQRCFDWLLEIEPQPAVLAPEVDYFGNATSFFTVQEPHHRMVVAARSELEIAAPPDGDPAATPPWEELRVRLARDRSSDALEALEMRFGSTLAPVTEEFADYAAASFAPGRPALEAVLDLTSRIHADFTYSPGATSVTTDVREVLETRVGVCQDFAHVQIACLRALGLAARYVSGYLRTHPSPGAPRLVGADASHAWVSVWLGGGDWVDVDPTNDLRVGDQHVTLAWGRDYADVAPIKGVILGGGGHTVEVAVDVEALDDDEP